MPITELTRSATGSMAASADGPVTAPSALGLPSLGEAEHHDAVAVPQAHAEAEVTDGAAMFSCSMRSKWCRLPPLSTISPTFSSTHGSRNAAGPGTASVAGAG